MFWYYANVTMHVLAALLWLGGMLFLGVVGAPVLRQVEPPALRAELFRRLGEGFRRTGWTAIAVLLVTGIINLYLRGVLRGEVRLAVLHVWLANVGLALMVTGWIVRAHAAFWSPILGVGALLAATGAFTFIYNIWQTLDGGAALGNERIVNIRRPGAS